MVLNLKEAYSRASMCWLVTYVGILCAEKGGTMMYKIVESSDFFQKNLEKFGKYDKVLVVLSSINLTEEKSEAILDGCLLIEQPKKIYVVL